MTHDTFISWFDKWQVHELYKKVLYHPGRQHRPDGSLKRRKTLRWAKALNIIFFNSQQLRVALISSRKKSPILTRQHFKFTRATKFLSLLLPPEKKVLNSYLATKLPPLSGEEEDRASLPPSHATNYTRSLCVRERDRK